MEAFWKVSFKGADGWGTGVIFTLAGQVYGGDEGFLYRGTYTFKGEHFSARVDVTRFNSAVKNVMGGVEEFDMDIIGLNMLKASGATDIVIEGSIPGTELRLEGRLTKVEDLPKRS